MTFAYRLKELREERKISQRELAEAIGISKGAVYYYENGRVPNVDTLEDIADYFSVSTDFILGRSNARTLNPKLKSICDKTGLSDESVLKLAELKKESSCRLRIINLLITQADSDIVESFFELAEKVLERSND